MPNLYGDWPTKEYLISDPYKTRGEVRYLVVGPTSLVRLRGRPPLPLRKQRITLMLNPQLKEHLVELAAQRGIGYQTLIQDFLHERVEQELNP